MVDVHSIETRSYNMSQIRSKNTKPELLVRKTLFANGYRYRIHDKDLPGKPDIVIKRYRTVIFVNGCFWHGHENCKYYVIPKIRTKWWLKKIEKTRLLDKTHSSILEELGWKVLIIFECQLKKAKREETFTEIYKFLSPI